MLVIAVGLSCYKLYLLEVGSRAMYGCKWCLSDSALAHEVQFILLVVLCHLASLYRSRVVQWGFRLFVLVAVFVTAVDLVVLTQFQVRFSLYELKKYITEFSALRDYGQRLFAGVWLPYLVLALVVISVGVLARYLLEPKRSRAPHPAVVLGVCVLILGAEGFMSVQYHEFFVENSLEAFLARRSRERAYSEELRASVASTGGEGQICFEGLGTRPNIALVIVESLSMYHSQTFSGLSDWMPAFDTASEQASRFPNFYANGVSTEDGLVALFTGLPPIPKTERHGERVFEQYRHRQSLPSLLNGFGYRTVFLTTGDLAFLGKGEWLGGIGFQMTEGHEAEFYSGMKRFHFGAAPDGALFDRALEEIAQKGDEPLFVAIESVSTHHPFVDPESGLRSEEGAFRYVDAQLGRFVESLEARGFFEDGYVIIVGDHRAMTPMSRDESVLYGDDGFARVPMVVLGAGMKGESTKSFSQTDLLPSVRHLLGAGRQCYDDNQGIFLPEALHEPACVYSRRSYEQDNVYIRCGETRYTVYLDGDDTRYVEGPEGPPRLLQQVHRVRLGFGF